MAASGADIRVMITGARGFVSSHAIEALRLFFGTDVTLIITAKEAGEHPVLGMVEALDVTNAAAVKESILRHTPTHVLHLAGIAAPMAAGANPQAAWQVNVQGSLNLGRAIQQELPECWLFHVGSGMVYGETAKLGRALDEDDLLAPIDEYSATKAAADLAMGALARQGLKCVRFRPFNHAGPGQAEAFVIPAFARQIAMIEAGLIPPVMSVGNLEAERDFLDVRDVARAYAMAIRECRTLNSGVILNVASGHPRSIEDVLYGLLVQSRAKISVRQDPARMRPSDLPRIVGDARRIGHCLGWQPEHAFDEMLAAVLNEWRARVSGVSGQTL